jgi:hypothetical protein
MTASFGTHAALTGRRRSRRVSVDLPTEVELVSGHCKAQLVSLSSTGASLVLDCEVPPKMGAELVLAFERFECFGKLVWRRGERVGIYFYDPLTEDEVIEARRASDTLNEREARRLQSFARAWVEGKGPGACRRI